MRQNLLHVGTSSFSEPDWIGPFYPQGTRPAEFLERYARIYRTVEIDATYYRIPAPKTVRGWYDRTPEGFIFAAKFPRSIVHGGEGAKPDKKVILMPESTYEERDRFLQSMSNLGDKLGPLVLQFPYFAADIFAGQNEFFERLDSFLEDLPGEFSYAVEIRNKYWLTEALRDILARHKVALTLIDQGWMPHGDEVAKKIDVVTAGFCYIRLLGDRKRIEAITEKFDREVIDQSERLERWVRLVGQMLDRDIETFIYTNNHFSGYSPATADRLLEMLAGS